MRSPGVRGGANGPSLTRGRRKKLELLRDKSNNMGDRTLFVPSHVGENVLPNLPFFHKLLRYAQHSPSPVAVRDLNAGIERTYHHVLSDVVAVRNELEKTLSAKARRDLAEDKEVYIGLIAPGGYEYTVGFIAILAVGAAVVPMGKCLQPRNRLGLTGNSRDLAC